MENLVKKVLSARGCSAEQIEQLCTFSPLSVSQCEPILKIRDRLLQAKQNNEKVFVGGDYDCDGICATTIMKDMLDKLKIENGYYIPNRFKEGYGLSAAIVEQAHQRGYSLIITVDNGVKAHEALAKAKELGIEVIVTDHHTMDEEVDCLAVLHPTLMEEQFQGLSGAGVAFELSQALLGLVPEHLILASISIISDVMELWNENRVIVRHGLACLNQRGYLNVSMLMNKPPYDEKNYSFSIIPKINSVGRLADHYNVNILVSYFLLKDKTQIETMARRINDINNERKTLTMQMIKKIDKVETSSPMLVLADEQFHEGLVGLVAGRFANDFHKPTLLFHQDENQVKGSGRSVAGFDLYSFLHQQAHLYSAFGGHPQAVGLSMTLDNFKIFQEFVASYKELDIESQTEELIEIDADDITVGALMQLRNLAPFGQGFELPRFRIRGLKLKNSCLLKEMYLKCQYEQGIEAISFRSDLKEVMPDATAVIGTLSLNEFKGQKKPSIQLERFEK